MVIKNSRVPIGTRLFSFYISGSNTGISSSLN